MSYINGRWIETDTRIDIINPATGQPAGKAGYGGEAEALAAVEAADNAFDHWRSKTAYERAGLLKHLADAIRANLNDLAATLTLEVGKPLAESQGEVGAAADQFEWYAEEVKRSSGDVIPNRMDDKRHMTIRHPVGPVAAISPWNFPLLLSARKMAPALAAGCTVVCRPASQAPLALTAVFRLLDSAGFPKGAANLVIGSPSACSRVFLRDDRIKKISFTGSLDVGRELYMESARQMKKISLELGGHSPFIVMPDADVREAAETAVISKFRNMGQVCISPSRFFVHHSVKEEFQALAAEIASGMKIGNGLDPFTQLGPLFDQRRMDATEAFVADIREKGGTILCGGRPPEGDEFDRGFFFEPTVATGITPEMS
ncbi:MAG: aldehyde dehydrogenase family protein, partial [Desulfobacterales bacterium]|nr:aldehyde dehydrogenase family protein [Desulfobacterales bacterium]